MPDRQVGKHEPQHREQNYSRKFDTLRKRADDQSGRDDRKRHLEGDEHGFRNRAAHGVDRQVLQKREFEPADNRPVTRHRQAVAERHP